LLEQGWRFHLEIGIKVDLIISFSLVMGMVMGMVSWVEVVVRIDPEGN
jgi:hypothetical protein